MSVLKSESSENAAAILLWQGFHLTNTSYQHRVCRCSLTADCIYFFKLLTYWHYYVDTLFQDTSFVVSPKFIRHYRKMQRWGTSPMICLESNLSYKLKTRLDLDSELFFNLKPVTQKDFLLTNKCIFLDILKLNFVFQTWFGDFLWMCTNTVTY